MTVRLKTLPDELRGGAWPSPVRVVRCLLKCSNERDPYHLLLTKPETVGEYTGGTAAEKVEEGGGHGRSV
jgi:hypothetical protein